MGLGILGLLCAALGVVMILMVPSMIRQQVFKVSEVSRVPGGEGGSGRRVRRWSCLLTTWEAQAHPRDLEV